ncbi:MAG: aspartyl protease family protein, partial [Pirellulales bacterium]
GGQQGISRRAPLSLNPGASFQTPPFWFFNNDLDIDNPQENPSQPTVIQGAMFLNVNVSNEGESLNNFQFFFDTGADVTVVSELNAARLGFDVQLDTPDFTVAVVGSGGTNLEVPGFFCESFTIQAIGGNVTLTNVPIVVLDVTNPADPGNVVDGIVGTNLLSGRNVVIDPNPSLGGGGVGPSLYISDPITTQKNWTTTAASGTFASGGNWNAGAAPTNLGVANVRHVSGGNQTAVVAADASVWELNVSGSASQSMTLQVNSGVKVTTFSGINIENNGVVDLQSGTLDAQFVEIVGGKLRGAGHIHTGSGRIPGQVENRGGTVEPGNGIGQLAIDGRFASDADGTLKIELGGLAAGTQYDQLLVDGGVALAGTLSISLANLGGGAFVPAAGDSFTIITATDGISGTFESLVGPAGYKWLVDYGDDAVTLFVGLSGDYNSDGTVNSADYSLWRDTLGEAGAGLAADGDGDGTVDADDYAVWKNHFGQSLSLGGGAISAVPEPTSLVLLLLAALAIAPVRSSAWLRCGAFSCR